MKRLLILSSGKMITYFFIAPYPLDAQNLPNLRNLLIFLISGKSKSLVKKKFPITEGQQKCNQVYLFFGTEYDWLGQLSGGTVIIQDFAQLFEAAIVHVGEGKLDVAQGGHFEF